MRSVRYVGVLSIETGEVMANIKVRHELTPDHKARYYIGDTFVGWRWLDSQFVLCALCHTQYLTLVESIEQHYRNNHKVE